MFWFHKNRLIFDKDKSLALGIHYKLNKNIVFVVITLKDDFLMRPNLHFLGVWLNHYLNWDSYVEDLMKKLSKLCFTVKP
jgi:hypothetical protein